MPGSLALWGPYLPALCPREISQESTASWENPVQNSANLRQIHGNIWAKYLEDAAANARRNACAGKNFTVSQPSTMGPGGSVTFDH